MLDDWAVIAPAPDRASFNVLRADSSHPLDFRIGRDVRGRFAFQLDASGYAGDEGVLDSPAGMDVLIDNIGAGRSRLTLLLRDTDDFDIFRVLCADLLEVTRSYRPEDASQAMHMLLGRLHQWQAILARRRQTLLSRGEIIGLVGELLFLLDLLIPKFGATPALAAWRGPYGDEQDFVLGATIFEVKTQATTADRHITISSEDQLDTSGSCIILCQQGLATCPPADGDGMGLVGLVRHLRDLVSGFPAALSRLDLGLAAIGYVEHPDYDELWKLIDRSFYEVREGFPRIVAANLPPGVDKVRYRIRAADCLPFRVDIDQTLGALQSDGH